MRIGLIGYGRMGHEIEEVAIARGHNVALIIDIDNSNDLSATNLKNKQIDVMIDFSSPSSAFENVKKCLDAGVPVVSGTTGWNDKYDQAVEMCHKNKTSFIQASNFSIGANIFFKLNAELSKHLEPFTDYKVAIEEIHHTKKLDAPSGTAITTAERIIENTNRYDSWALMGEKTELGEKSIPVTAIREGNVPGTHTVLWESPIEAISFIHETKNRKGLATGAVVAAEFIHNKKGVFTMADVLGFNK